MVVVSILNIFESNAQSFDAIISMITTCNCKFHKNQSVKNEIIIGASQKRKKNKSQQSLCKFVITTRSLCKKFFLTFFVLLY